jgi:hypothetical protein
MSKWEDGPRASFEIDGESDRVTFVLTEITEAGGNRIAKRERVFRDGERLDGMGTKGDVIGTRSSFFNGVEERGIAPNQYDDVLGPLIAILKRSVTTTGTLRLPTKAPLRVKAETWNVREDAGRKDFAYIDITWATDTEEVELESTFGQPNARSVAVSISEDILAQIEFMGVTSDDIAELKSIGAKLEQLAQQANERGDDLLQAARDAQESVANIEGDFLPSSTALDGDDLVVGATADSMLALPIAYSTLVLLRSFAEVAATAAANVPGRTVPAPKLYPTALSIFEIAIDNGLTVEEVVELNPTLDYGFIPANTPILLPGVE